jgi:sporulation protein YlmC with PRC-barrel domain
MTNLHSQTGRKWVETDRVIDRLVFDHDGKSIGTIRRLLIDRRSGRVEQVVVHTHGHFSFGALDLELP